jgi:hypothetical protein
MAWRRSLHHRGRRRPARRAAAAASGEGSGPTHNSQPSKNIQVAQRRGLWAPPQSVRAEATAREVCEESLRMPLGTWKWEPQGQAPQDE